MKRITAIIVGVVALALGATTYAAVIRSHAKHARVTHRAEMLITSQVDGMLYPGSVRPVKLRIKNLLGRKVKLLGVVVKVHKPSGSCPIWAVTGSRVATHSTLGKGSTHTLWASLRMDPRSPNSCQGARVPLSFNVVLDGHL